MYIQSSFYVEHLSHSFLNMVMSKVIDTLVLFKKKKPSSRLATYQG